MFRFSPANKDDEDRSSQVQKVSGKPELVHAVCAAHYVNSSGHVIARSIDVTISTTGAPGVTVGQIDGKAAVVNGSEQSRFAIGTMDVKASAGSDTRTAIEGFQVTDNTNDTRRFGGFRVSVEGTNCSDRPGRSLRS